MSVAVIRKTAPDRELESMRDRWAGSNLRHVAERRFPIAGMVVVSARADSFPWLLLCRQLRAIRLRPIWPISWTPCIVRACVRILYTLYMYSAHLYCNDAPWKSIVSSSIYLCRSEAHGNRGRARTTTNAADRHLVHRNPAPHYPRRMGKISDGRNRETLEILEHAYKKMIFWRRFHFARQPTFRTAESAIPLRFLEQTNDETKGCSLSLPSVLDSRPLKPFLDLWAFDETKR